MHSHLYHITSEICYIGEGGGEKKGKETKGKLCAHLHSVVFMIQDEHSGTIVTLNVMACNLRKPTLGYNERAN